MRVSREDGKVSPRRYERSGKEKGGGGGEGEGVLCLSNSSLSIPSLTDRRAGTLSSNSPVQCLKVARAPTLGRPKETTHEMTLRTFQPRFAAGAAAWMMSPSLAAICAVCATTSCWCHGLFADGSSVGGVALLRRPGSMPNVGAEPLNDPARRGLSRGHRVLARQDGPDVLSACPLA